MPGPLYSFFLPPSAGGGSITVTFEPDPSVYAADMDRMAEEFNEMHEPLTLSAQAAAESFGRMFDSAGEGEWPPPARDYGWPLLLRTGAFKAGAMSMGSFAISARDVFWTGGAIPQYGWYHIFGATRGTKFGAEQRKFAEHAKSMGFEVVEEGLGENVLPRRDPIKVDDTAVAEMDLIWEAWFNKIVGM